MNLIYKLTITLGILMPSILLGQTNWREMAVPAYTLSDYASGATRLHSKHAEQLAADSERLSQVSAQLSTHCQQADALAQVQQQWRQTVASWDQLAAVSVGPVVTRRSARHIDFMPVRPEMLARAVNEGTPLERVGAPARGFSALEFLLWSKPLKSESCRYIAALAEQIQTEAQALAQNFLEQTHTPVENEAALALLVENINQWVAGIEQLRWAFMRKPLDMANTHAKTAQYPRQLSTQTQATWLARWQALREVAVLDQRPIPQPGSQDPVPLETLLRSRGLNDLADQLVQAVQQVQNTLPALSPLLAASVHASADALARISKLTQEAIAPALNVRLGFSDADGD